MFKSKTQPYCLCCGKPIRKFVRNVHVNDAPGQGKGIRMKLDSPTEWGRVIEPSTPLRSKEQCQPYTNQHIVSIKYHSDWDMQTDTYSNRRVRHFGEWDGESYIDPYFCNRTVCAVDYAYILARTGHKVPHRTLEKKGGK